MAVIKTFKCVHPAEDKIEKVAALPYDVYNREEALAVAKKNPLSFINIDRPETQFETEHDMYADDVYQKAADMLNEWIDNGTFVEEREDAFYVYELTMNGRTQTGLVACASIDDYVNNVIKKHENTREEKEIDRIRHVDTVGAQTGPIFLAYRKNNIVSAIINKAKSKNAMFDFTSEDGIRHRVFKIDDAVDIEEIKKAFEDINDIYIADGHHRAASAVKVGLKRRNESVWYNGEEEFNYFLSVLFPDEELMIMPYNRVLYELNGMSEEEFLAKLKDTFEVVAKDSGVEPREKQTYGMYLSGQWYEIRPKEKVNTVDPVKNLDVSVLQNLLFEPLLGIEDPRTDKRIDFIGGIRGIAELERLVDEQIAKVAFSVYPTSISELFAVSDAKMLMPPKSTWFEPKLRSGIFIHKI